MMTRKTRLLLGGILYVLLVSAQASAQGLVWHKHVVAATETVQEARYRDAEETSQAAFRCGGRDQRLAASLNNLAEAYRKQGKYVLAEPLYQKSVAIWEKTLGLNHPAVAVGLNNLALLYTAQGNYARAESLYQRSREIWEDVLGPDSLYLAINLENHASLLRRMNREAEAVKMETRAKAIRAKHTRDHHAGESVSMTRGVRQSFKSMNQVSTMYLTDAEPCD
ncbi:MAG: tetratricopeptide repeat protein [Candidatus Binatia bacterium]